ncbi:DsbA family protein [Aquisalimonas sp.]|uniref:DsbA family oxidoreductase n=1 Tax=Aquisalimonas sp. TaxID=1872621 RepID=UPI0025C38AC6|nr:DsbA family protein [Aquisalimonas sp.]
MTTQAEAHNTIAVTLFFDYNCPFCYVASHRLERLQDRYNLDILWRFVEIHPGNPAVGQPLSALGYADEHWQRLTQALDEMVSHDRLPWQPRQFTTNTRRALLLAQTVQLYRRGCFLPLHRALFHAYFAQGRNIGDDRVLEALAREHGVDDLVEAAWATAEPLEVFLSHVQAAQELELTGVPALVVSGRAFHGVVSMEILEQALGRAASGA